MVHLAKQTKKMNDRQMEVVVKELSIKKDEESLSLVKERLPKIEKTI
jgi:hypothetical protein